MGPGGNKPPHLTLEGIKPSIERPECLSLSQPDHNAEPTTIILLTHLFHFSSPL